MQDHIGSREHALGSQETCSRAKEREELGGPSTLILMRLQDRVTFWLPRRPRLRDGLVGSSFILVYLDDACRFRLLARQLDQSFFSGVCTS